MQETIVFLPGCWSTICISKGGCSQVWLPDHEQEQQGEHGGGGHHWAHFPGGDIRILSYGRGHKNLRACRKIRKGKWGKDTCWLSLSLISRMKSWAMPLKGELSCSTGETYVWHWMFIFCIFHLHTYLGQCSVFAGKLSPQMAASQSLEFGFAMRWMTEYWWVTEWVTGTVGFRENFL